ncbi:hypothetical protein BDN70DRAFT_795763 [Pholiota conissans]|uniref:Transmembrane protein n=1 Tax=Pholiota conissans TaxID=109636 RepID=A0A9P5ZE38_9AGAR|nr:hypothetical protein BDN70DRAFT_795763 [Pholiota conissans]
MSDSIDDLPPTVKAVRDGWQLTCQGSAVVSGLLAGVAAQLFSYFRDPTNYTRHATSRGLVLALCYGAIFLNIGATIGAFIIIDKMGSIATRAARRDQMSIGRFGGTQIALLQYHGAGKKWKYFVWHWVICFYGGTICLAVLLLTFIVLEENLSIVISMSCLCGFVLLPSLLYFVLND